MSIQNYIFGVQEVISDYGLFHTWKGHIHVRMKHFNQLGCLWARSCTHVQNLHKTFVCVSGLMTWRIPRHRYADHVHSFIHLWNAYSFLISISKITWIWIFWFSLAISQCSFPRYSDLCDRNLVYTATINFVTHLALLLPCDGTQSSKEVEGSYWRLPGGWCYPLKGKRKPRTKSRVWYLVIL